jgi:methyl-accepting chemotaxis protein
MIEKLTLRTKLFLATLIPLAGLAYFAGNQVLGRFAVAEEMDEVTHMTGLAVTASAAIHELQKERGLSSAFLEASDGAARADLDTQRNLASRAIAELGAAAARSSVAAGDLEALMSAIHSELDGVLETRRRADARSASAAEIRAQYTEVIRSLLGLGAALSDRTADPGTMSLLDGLTYLTTLKEYAGQERAVVAGACARGVVDPATRRELHELIARQATMQDVYLGHASDAEVEAFKAKMTGRHAAAVDALRELALGAGGDSLAGRRAEWWDAATGRIDLLHALERHTQEAIIETAASRQGSAQTAAALGLVFTLILVVVSGGLSLLLAQTTTRTLLSSTARNAGVVQQIRSSVQQLSAASVETATSVTQTTSTVDEIRQTSTLAEQKSAEMSDACGRSIKASDRALDAVAGGIEIMRHIRTEVENIAQKILELGARNAQIGEIVQSVNAVAEQSNLLAVNASIEAAKAGDAGRGFSVVAREVKALAQQSKGATDRIRVILAEVQKSSNSAVMTAEQGVKRVEEGVGLIEEVGRGIQELAAVLEHNAEQANQLLLTARQQVVGIEEITEAIHNIEQAANDNAQSAGALEEAAGEIGVVSDQLARLVNGRTAA